MLTHYRTPLWLVLPIILVALLSACNPETKLPATDRSVPTDFVPGAIYILQRDVYIEYGALTLGAHWFAMPTTFNGRDTEPDYRAHPNAPENRGTKLLRKGTHLRYLFKYMSHYDGGPSPSVMMKAITGPFAGELVDCGLIVRIPNATTLSGFEILIDPRFLKPVAGANAAPTPNAMSRTQP